jgi:NitT/TauT family transport system substrate-binding protein
MRAATWVLATALWGLSALPVLAKTIDIAIGHQSLCTDTYTAGIIVKERHLLEKHLPHTGKYAGVKYHITWNDYSSGGPITNEMLAGKLNFGVMGDYPLIVNGAQFQATH